jgi:hypothetical protein
MSLGVFGMAAVCCAPLLLRQGHSGARIAQMGWAAASPEVGQPQLRARSASRERGINAPQGFEVFLAVCDRVHHRLVVVFN